MSQVVTTNLRIERADWLQIKTMAAELGMSVNKFINQLIRRVTTKEQLGVINDYQNASIWEELPKLAKIKNKPGKLSADDEIIYA
ncbi:MAG: hypothetical protein UX85_C0004G0128 [Candidatus Beckwithbacteria bacterium GW2011_GWB1_47_15]|uniref:Uncharacterized protein n=1 Tax=Candidatus Beckwithbacteria bacterium GW2011_GWB1_47_15 TaxID=1618371 RepID=A0A0G1RVT5_9BACT|nr:MAG: hypothetical protein UY43_C0001G0107 [Candidatus Beckwithbacteria bacterium GW2011_GWC1_49_16]KKU35531.1 MAG: hypothetical protein UX50_C0003G0128 [Candidatus Beckwithbacteria bacterium GW2011_GWA1_46_30]KKU61206.1 MAG: hypothetical protein UX85_C0004G0128 [Candidatus Beckwithbacteria bacterium GW2011_GWB1_47_15]KKU72045.1 MAG: hypothetical protein UX97_C0002G0128 [Candidatus Beckwithbacteria bacterium GW2011_GWA2_47_25]KKW03283.1 MAG: hypothetical protein UY37_C0006G0108 [Candidatus Be